MNAIKQNILTVIYKLWLFFAKTWLGNMLTVCLVVSAPILILSTLLPNLFDGCDAEESEGIAGGVALICLSSSTLIAKYLFKLSSYLQTNYTVIS